MFTKKDLDQIKALGSQAKNIQNQIENFKKGFPPAQLAAAATIENNGINSISESDAVGWATVFDTESRQKKILKFVPASGAATRMFKGLFEAMLFSSENKELNHENFSEALTFIRSVQRFAFYDKLKDILFKNGIELDACLKNRDYHPIFKYLLTEEGLNYGQLPKALLDFHKYGEITRTSLEEHLVEGTVYAKQKNQSVALHFTVSNEHIPLFEKKISQITPIYEMLYDVKFSITLSAQKSSTDTIAVTEDNELFRDHNHQLVFRPGGHGALIENLNECNADLIFIKNIDNVVIDDYKETTYLYKKALGGLLFSTQKKIFAFLHLLDNESSNEIQLNEMEQFIETELHITLPSHYFSFSTLLQKKTFLRNKLNRPIRICGMVKNEGEPGGGPFFVANSEGEISLQIIESSQVNHNDPDQERIFKESTHFNPVDLVCGIKDYKRNPFSLMDYIDPKTGFISLKSKDGKSLKAQELPGLWNGAMAGWITLFVEIPLSTFNPVKTVNDLLRPFHQPKIW